MRGADSRIIEAIVGALLAAALLLAAFAVIAQEPAGTGWALAAQHIFCNAGWFLIAGA